MIYLLEDDAAIRELVCYALCGAGLEASGFERPSAFFAAVSRAAPALAILDLMLPEEDGLSVLRRLRAAPATASLPVLLLTAKGSEYDKVAGLDAGADDYLAKPFGMMELIARVRALLRRSGQANDAREYALGPLRVSPGRHTVHVDGQPVALTRKEFELLCLLLARPGMVFTREQLLDQVWGYHYGGESRTVDVHVRTLRQKLGRAGEMVETVRGVGYKIGESHA